MEDRPAAGLTVPSLTVALGAGCEIPSHITARISSMFAANEGAGGVCLFRSVFVWPYNNVVALGNLCAHVRQARAAGYTTRYLVLLDMRFAAADTDPTLKLLLRLITDQHTAVVLYNVSASAPSTHVPVELMDSVGYVVSDSGAVSTDTHSLPVRYPVDKRRPPSANAESQMKEDLELLGLDPADKTLTIQRIRKQYKRAALESHPDKNSAEDADDQFRAVHAAFKRIERVFFYRVMMEHDEASSCDFPSGALVAADIDLDDFPFDDVYGDDAYTARWLCQADSSLECLVRFRYISSLGSLQYGETPLRPMLEMIRENEAVAELLTLMKQYPQHRRYDTLELVAEDVVGFVRECVLPHGVFELVAMLRESVHCVEGVCDDVYCSSPSDCTPPHLWSCPHEDLRGAVCDETRVLRLLLDISTAMWSARLRALPPPLPWKKPPTIVETAEARGCLLKFFIV
jgi:hypothetical protein